MEAMSGGYPPGSFGAALEELADKINALGAEIKREHPWLWRRMMIRSFPRRFKRKVSCALPCRVFGHKWEDNACRTVTKCARCGQVGMGPALRRLLERMWS